MNVYDFDGTLYHGDSTADFVKWCARRYPLAALTLPRSAFAAVACMGLHAISKTQFKSVLYRFLKHVPDVESEVGRFWEKHEHLIGGPCSPRPGDYVISASPEFLLRDVCERRGFVLLASQVDPCTGKVLGPNCVGEEKVVRLKERVPDAVVDEFYSDSRNDDPLAALAACAYYVDLKKGSLAPWPR